MSFQSASVFLADLLSGGAAVDFVAIGSCSGKGLGVGNRVLKREKANLGLVVSVLKLLRATR